MRLTSSSLAIQQMRKRTFRKKSPKDTCLTESTFKKLMGQTNDHQTKKCDVINIPHKPLGGTLPQKHLPNQKHPNTEYSIKSLPEFRKLESKFSLNVRSQRASAFSWQGIFHSNRGACDGRQALGSSFEADFCYFNSKDLRH